MPSVRLHLFGIYTVFFRFARWEIYKLNATTESSHLFYFTSDWLSIYKRSCYKKHERRKNAGFLCKNKMGKKVWWVMPRIPPGRPSLCFVSSARMTQYVVRQDNAATRNQRQSRLAREKIRQLLRTIFREKTVSHSCRKNMKNLIQFVSLFLVF